MVYLYIKNYLKVVLNWYMDYWYGDYFRDLCIMGIRVKSVLEDFVFIIIFYLEILICYRILI